MTRVAALALAALFACAAQALADGDADAHYLPADARNGGIRVEGRNHVIVYDTSAGKRDALGFAKKELFADGWRVEWCNGSSKSTFCALTASHESAGALVVEVKDGFTHVSLALTKR